MEAPISDDCTPVWTAQRKGEFATILVRLLPRGLEVGMDVGGSLIYTVLFETGAEVWAWVRENCAEMEARGWLPSDGLNGRELE